MTPIEWQTLLKKLRDKDTSLRKLKLQHKQIDNAKAKELAIALNDNRTLTELDLSYNNIGDEGVIALAATLEVNRSLMKFCLSSNNISDTGAIALATSLTDNRSLIMLELEHNEINDVGAKAFVAALSKNRTLIIFRFRWYELLGFSRRAAIVEKDERISDAIEKEIDFFIDRNCKLADKMHEAVKKGDIFAINGFIQQGVSLLANPSWYSSINNTALHWAVIAKQPQMITYLLDLMHQQGLVLDTRNQDNKTAADLAKGTEFEALFASSVPTLKK
jgi:hypothetical protein